MAGAVETTSERVEVTNAVPVPAFSTSARTIRPWGPEPLRPARSIPFSAAMRRASGLALMRVSPLPTSASFIGVEASCADTSLPVPFAGSGDSPAPAPVCRPLPLPSGFGGGGDEGGEACPVEGAVDGATPALSTETLPVSSPSSARTAITALTATPSVPSATRISTTVPSSTASTSIVALSVSISAMMSPASTVSPAFTSHFDSVPSSMVGDRAGMVMEMGIRRRPRS